MFLANSKNMIDSLSFAFHILAVNKNRIGKLVSRTSCIFTVLLPYREQNLTPKMPKCSLYGRTARIGNKDFLISRKKAFLLYQRSKNTYLHHCNCPFQSFCCLESLEISKIARFQIEREFSQKFLTRTSLK